ncbi:hypothetical protein SAMN02982929_05108 [Saccharopolyspora kobensis]|uniref:Excreted virulence factor EspC, type VII ESX diderm n=1 Tax=Saccharopolyspora kobensis TaxID=146035 RepID=A0A1H6DYT0_9PSEU|nr:hypothetical protein [Saccharopolyspora kobensis]SEG89926.1 hypothetical protein SAMN02982929_05108 [Saccharopolyspora kobensis]SFD88092.1 hypothetical protein SAMN05216506_10781 [Saccharopolyspora kobensis]
MAENLKAIPAEMKGFEGLLERNAGYFKKIDEWAESTASDTSGFTGLMMVLIPVVEMVTALYGETLEWANSALLKVKEDLADASAEYEEIEQKIVGIFRQIQSDLDDIKI